jgi:hypothetical protein
MILHFLHLDGDKKGRNFEGAWACTIEIKALTKLN